MQGRSTLPLCRYEPVAWPDEVFIQISEAELGRAIRTRRWKYSVFAPDRDPNGAPASRLYHERCLYDLAADPHERVNLIGRVDQAEIARYLRERLIAHMVQAGEALPEIVPAQYPVA
jgi:arylsulfatase A-like enzyme